MSIFLEDLKAKALAATPGEWTLRDRGVICGGPVTEYFRGKGQPQIVMCCGGEQIGHEQKTANEHFIVAARPEVVLDLLERLENSESERDALKSEVERLTPMQFRPAPCHAACESTAFNIEIRKLKAELEALGHRFNDVSIALSVANKECTILSSEKAALSAQLEAARKQEPVGWYNEGAGTTTVFNAKFLRSSPPEGCVPVYASPVPAQNDLAVWYGPMPESNGKTNWTAILYRKNPDCRMGGIGDGYTIDRSEYPDRVRYEADRVRHLIGELKEPPFILDYDENKHSGYEEQQPSAVTHWSDCSTNNGPAMEPGECDCGGYPPKEPPCATE